MNFLVRAVDRDRLFWGVYLGVLLIKVAIAVALPMTGDEAYFVLYARNVDWGGFYDHPPMVGWLIWLMERIGSHPLVIRLPAIALGFVLALGTYGLLRGLDERRARLVSLLLLFSPIYLVTVLISSDTGLIMFGFLAGLAYYRGASGGRYRFFLLAGVLLGLSFMSKYFAALLGVAFLAHFLLFARGQWRGFALLILGVLPFIVWNIAWNYLHCWDHLMFNLFNRHGGGGFSLETVVVYLLMVAYLLALPLWYLLRNGRDVVEAMRARRMESFLVMAAVPLLVWLLLSLRVSIGLHWMLLFVPFLYMAYHFLPRAALERSVRFMGWYGAAHVLLVAVILSLPASLFEDTELHFDVVFHGHPEAMVEALEHCEADVHATNSYSRAAVLAYYGENDWAVYGGGGRHARLDDSLTDWRALDGGRMVFLHSRARIRPGEDDLAEHFESVRVERLSVRGIEFEIAIAEGFDYASYRDDVLARVRERFYDFPDWLPVGGCTFTERYFEP